MFAMPLIFDFFKRLVYPYGLKDGSIVRLEFYLKSGFV